ncbi:hypothetical protein EDC04DRAFT_2995437 [Pisolithus marmoratus]|nr:hypothetical protein EDC04DRAFT_2995437 [Pisolithus marmoratus]
MAIAWSSQLAFDAIVFVLTLWRTLHGRRLGNRTLLDIFNWLWNVVDTYDWCQCREYHRLSGNVLQYAIRQQRNHSFHGSPTCKDSPNPTPLTHSYNDSISSTMVSRLMLNLRDPEISMSPQPLMPIAHQWRRNSIFKLQTVKGPGRNAHYVAED